MDEDFKDDDKFGLTPWGCLYAVLTDYGIDITNITGTIGKHMVEDFMALMEQHGHVVRREDG